MYVWICIVVAALIITNSVAAGFGRHGMPPPASNPHLWPFDLETGVRVASKVGNLLSKFGHARPLGSRIIRYVRDRRTDRQTDKSNAYCPFATGGGIIQQETTWTIFTFTSGYTKTTPAPGDSDWNRHAETCLLETSEWRQWAEAACDWNVLHWSSDWSIVRLF